MLSTDEGLLWMYAMLLSKGFVMRLDYFGPNVPSSGLWVYEGSKSVFICVGTIAEGGRENTVRYIRENLQWEALASVVETAYTHMEQWKQKDGPYLPVNPLRSNLR